jgi:hypothetical protein
MFQLTWKMDNPFILRPANPRGTNRLTSYFFHYQARLAVAIVPRYSGEANIAEPFI